MYDSGNVTCITVTVGREDVNCKDLYHWKTMNYSQYSSNLKKEHYPRHTCYSFNLMESTVYFLAMFVSFLITIYFFSTVI